VRLLLIVIGLVWIAIPADALAKPKAKLAVAPLNGDPGNKVGNAIVDALAGKDFVVIAPKDTHREMTKAGMSDQLDGKAARKLAKKLDAIAVIDGDVGKAGKKRSLHVQIHRRGKPDADFTLQFKTTTSEGFRRTVHDEVMKKLDDAGGPDQADDDDDDAKKLAAARAAEEDDRKRKLADDEAATRRAKQRDDDEATSRRAKQRADEDATTKRSRSRTDDDPGARKRKRTAETDDDAEPSVRKRKSRKRAEDDAAPLVVARASAGASLAQRRLSWETRAGLTALQMPPSVVTTAGAARVDGELYPFALANPSSSLAGLGFAGAYEKTLGLSIKVPNQTVRAPIDQARYSIGARYRLRVGDASSVTLGLDYVRQHYIADRSGLMAAVLDTPDFDYTAIAPGAGFSTPLGSSIALFAGLDGLLILNTGPVQDAASYGPATVYGIDAVTGLDIALARQIGLRIALAYSQISFSFSGKGTQATNRDNDTTPVDVNGATDRAIGLTATIGVTY